mgnify:CR=1 FL=1
MYHNINRIKKPAKLRAFYFNIYIEFYRFKVKCPLNSLCLPPSVYSILNQ